MIGFERFGRHAEISPAESGRVLVSELSCGACHATDDPWLSPKRGPRLTGAGRQLRREWLRDYLNAPHSVKPGTTMPDVLATVPAEKRGQVIEALVAYLSSQQEPFEEIKAGGASPVIHEFWKRGDADRGSKRYHTVGCVACHAADSNYETVESKPSAIDALLKQLDPEEIADLGLASEARGVPAIPHGKLEEKYSRRSLTMMLLDPTRSRPNARMPSLRLTPAEAADIATYLLVDAENAPLEIVAASSDKELLEKGRTLFQELRCAACHEAGDQTRAKFSPATPWNKLSAQSASNCIQNPSGRMPHYATDSQQRDAIEAILKLAGDPDRLADNDRSAADEVHFRMLQLNCYGCHRRNELGGVGRFRKPYFETIGNIDLGDEGRLPPTLSGVGRKLRPKALAGVFHPKTSPHRPYMTVRMPSYGADTVDSIVSGLPKADNVDPSNAEDIFANLEGLNAPGRDLANTGCVGCHAFRGETLPGVVGIDLNRITNRIRPRWFYDFVLNPSSVKERTRMPTFFPGGKSNRKDLLDGEVHQQISSLWAYLKNLDTEPLPEKIEEVRSANYELAPVERPIVLRTFMKTAGTHAIAVGFPEGVHFAFDAESVRPAVGWKTAFLDARGTWFERFAPPAEPLGDAQIAFPPGGLLIEPQDAPYQFQGYRLDPAGVPTMLYQVGSVSVEDRIEPINKDALKRTITFKPNAPEQIRLRVHAGNELTGKNASTYRDQQGLTVRLPETLADAAIIQDLAGQQQWIVPLRLDKKQSIVLEYTW